MDTNDEIPKASILSRVLAWILIVAGSIALFGIAAEIYRHKGWPWGFEGTLFAILATLGCYALSFNVAFKGRSPRWLTSIETQFNQEIGRYGVGTTTAKSFRGFVFTVSSVVFSLLLILFVNQLDLFSGESRWFAIIVFALTWLLVVALMWRYFRNKHAGSRDASEESRK